MKVHYFLRLCKVFVVFLPLSTESWPLGEVLCDLKKAPIALLRRNPETGEYVIDQHRVLITTEEAMIIKMERSDLSPEDSKSISNSIRPKGGALIGDGLIFTNWEKQYARICCTSGYYCAFPATHCDVNDNPSQWSENQKPRCLIQNRSTNIVRRLLPFMVSFYGCLVTFLVFTKNGRGIVNYAIGYFHSTWNEEVADQMLVHDARRAEGLIRIHIRRRRRELAVRHQMMMGLTIGSGNHEPRELKALILKTRKYKSPINGPLPNDTEDERNDPSCSICYEPLQDGEKVGVLPCDHLFHSSCLKTWLTRRNVCPLCQAIEIATPSYADEEDEDNIVDSNNQRNQGGSIRNLLSHFY